MKVELHTHTADDPVDRIPHTTEQLIDHAAALGYGALAVTLHDRWFDAARLEGYARDRGITLISGIEHTLNGKHVLILNAPREVERARSWADLAAIKRDSCALVVAPHPFYPIGSAVGGRGLRDGSGVVDAWTFYRGGVPFRHEQDTNGDGFRDRVGHYENGKLAREAQDLDGDGHPDRVARYDAAGEVVELDEDADGNGVIDQRS